MSRDTKIEMHPPKSPTVAAGLCMMHHRPRHTLARSNQSEPGMCYVRLPSSAKPLALGFPDIPLSKKSSDNKRNDEGEQIDNNVVLFVDTQAARSKVLLVGLYSTMLIVFILSIVHFTLETNGQGAAQLVIAHTLIGMGAFAMLYKNTHVLNIFIAVTYIEAMIGALTLSSFLEFVLFITKMVLCYAASQVHHSMLANWFSPLH
ncbi:hypothetical protein AAMO2058_000805400 [Amorphochlora amoebiformis]